MEITVWKLSVHILFTHTDDVTKAEIPRKRLFGKHITSTLMATVVRIALLSKHLQTNANHGLCHTPLNELQVRIALLSKHLQWNCHPLTGLHLHTARSFKNSFNHMHTETGCSSAFGCTHPCPTLPLALWAQ